MKSGCLLALIGAGLACPVWAEGAGAAPMAVRMTPYLFGTSGQAHDSVIHLAVRPGDGVAGGDSGASLQLGWGMQFNELLGAEAYVQGGARHTYHTVSGERLRQAARVFGGRVTLGLDLGERWRLFAKAGISRVVHSGRGTWSPTLEEHGYSNRQSRSALGVGMAIRLTDGLSLRADADHIFQRRNEFGTGWGNLNHIGLGLQYRY
jgi:hypothetical protein